MATQEQRWATAELTLDVEAATKIRRTPGVVIAITALLVLAVGLTAAVDLRRLQSPRGAALAWTEAAVFGDCRAFLALSRPIDREQDRRTDDRICQDLRGATKQARAVSTRIRITAAPGVRRARTADVSVRVQGPDGSRQVLLHLVRRGGDWLVLRQPGACGDAPCL